MDRRQLSHLYTQTFGGECVTFSIPCVGHVLRDGTLEKKEQKPDSSESVKFSQKMSVINSAKIPDLH
jgi:hypothetical protein